jgi:hypothetical protein
MSRFVVYELTEDGWQVVTRTNSFTEALTWGIRIYDTHLLEWV